MHVLVMLLQEKTSLHIAGNMAIRAALESDSAARVRDHPTQTGHLINNVDLPLATADVPARWVASPWGSVPEN